MNLAIITAKRLSFRFLIGLASIYQCLILRHPLGPTIRRVPFPRPVRVQLLPFPPVDQEDERHADNQYAGASVIEKRKRADSGGRWKSPFRSGPDPHSHPAP